MGQRVIKVDQHTRNGEIWDISDFLKLIPQGLRSCKWIIVESESLEFVFKQHCECPSERVITYEEMIKFSEHVLQSVWATYLGDSSLKNLELYDRTEYMDSQADRLNIDIGFEAVDSSYWLVTARDESVLRLIEDGCAELVR